MHACDLNVAIDLRGLRQIPVSAAYQSCAATSSAIALIGVGRRHTALPRANPHSARGTVACHFPRFRSLKAFGRRPRCKPQRRDRPASETLNIRYRGIRPQRRPMSAMPPKGDKPVQRSGMTQRARADARRTRRAPVPVPNASDQDQKSRRLTRLSKPCGARNADSVNRAVRELQKPDAMIKGLDPVFALIVLHRVTQTGQALASSKKKRH